MVTWDRDKEGYENQCNNPRKKFHSRRLVVTYRARPEYAGYSGFVPHILII